MNHDELLGMRILIVDDEPVNIALLEDILQLSGYTRIESTSDSRRVRQLCLERRPDLILLDLNMPNLDGFAVMRQLSQDFEPTECVPILVLTADIGLETKRRALSVGATDFLTKPFDHVEVLLRIGNLLRTRHQHLQLSDQKRLLEDTVRERTSELRETLDRLRETQGQMVVQERLSALGGMTAGIAHDFNNVLSLILGYSEMLTRSLERPEGVRNAGALLGTIINAAQDAAKMFTRLRQFYRPADQGHAHQGLDLNVLVEQAVALTRPRWHGQALGQGVTVDLRTELSPGLPEIVADAAELREMLTNLIFNAVDAIPAPGGTVTLRTRAADDGEAVYLEIADTGVGMDEETRRRCLEPFFTTKGTLGTGLGLAMVYGTMQRHNGSIALESSPGQGTTFTFLLPLGQETPAPVPLSVVGATRPLNILAVDDQEVLTEIVAEYLAEDLHHVETAFDGGEALAKFRAGSYDLVITDMAMPGMGGEQLAAAVKGFAPQTRVILLTGYAASGDGGRLPRHVDLMVDKPVTREALRQAVAAVMAAVDDSREYVTEPAMA